MPKVPGSGVMLMSNLLVSDKSAHTIITTWNDAALALNNELYENDIILLKDYKISKFKSKQKLKYQFSPKISLMNSPTEIELKINEKDLNNIFIVRNNTQLVPTSVWNFKTVKSLVEGSHSKGRLLDIVGVLLITSRFEREQIYLQGTSSGQYNIRQWIGICDDTTNTILYIQTYLNKQNREKLSNYVVPGDILLLTNLIIISDQGKVLYLTTSNETQLFISPDFDHPKFDNCRERLSNIKTDSTKINLEKWLSLYQRFASIGGYVNPLKTNLCKNILNIFFDRRFQVHTHILNLPFKCTSRFILRATVTNYYKVTFKNKKVHKVVKFDSSFVNEDAIGINQPILLPTYVDGIDRKTILNLNRNMLKLDCDLPVIVNKKDNHDMTTHVIEFKSTDFNLLAEYYLDIEKILPLNVVDKFEIEAYRALRYNKDNVFDGVTFVTYGPHDRKLLLDKSQNYVENVSTQDVADTLM